jgi:putative PIN family toxin of toxin-antitoxin system
MTVVMEISSENSIGSPKRVVLDTNVVLDILHYRDPDGAGLHVAIRGGVLQPVTSVACLEELRCVLKYPEFRLDEPEAAALFSEYRSIAVLVSVPDTAPPDLPRCRDPDDQKFLQLAQQSGAHYLVTRDKALLRLSRAAQRVARFAILTPAGMREALQSSAARRLESASSAARVVSSMDQTTLR